MIHKKVKFQGNTYWYHADRGWINISPLDHYDETGDLIVNPLVAISFAVIQDNDIMQFGDVVGNVSELEDVNES